MADRAGGVSGGSPLSGEATPFLEGAGQEDIEKQGFAAERAEHDETVNALDMVEDAFARTYVRKARSPYGRLFMYDKNWTFAQALELSCRGALVLLLFGTPLILGYQKTKGSFFYSNELFSASAIVMFVYTLYLSLGDTISYTVAGMLGTISACMGAWIMFGLFDQGFDGKNSEAWWFGAFFGIGYVVVTLTLNFSTLAQVFALSNFVWHWMTFMSPELQKNDVDNIFGVTITLFGFQGIMTSLGGCILALASISLPYPILALSKACDVAEDITTCVGESWDTAIKFYCSDVKIDHQQTRLRQEMGETQGYIAYLQGYVDSSWWEALLIPKWKRIRLMLHHLNKVHKEAFDRLMHVIVRSCSREEFDAEHQKVMGRCHPFVTKVVTGAKGVLNKCTEAANNGGLKSQDEEGLLEKQMQEVKDAMANLTQEFQKVKKELDLLDTVSASLIDEHVFAFEVCVFGRITNELAESFIKDARARRGEPGEKLEKVSNELAIVWLIKKIFDKEVLTDPEHLNFALRNTISILLGFAIGLVGYHNMISKNNAGISSTAAVLLSRYGGSAVTKNLNRLLGVAIGELAGSLIYSLLGYCSWWGYASLMILTFFWTLGMLFTYYHSARLGSVACLMAAFGTQRFLAGCSDDWVDPTGTYHNVINCVISIGLMMIVDTVFGLGLPSKKAAKAFEETWDLLIKNVTEVFDKETDIVHEQGEAIVADLGRARALSMEAKEENRNWRTPWKDGLFDEALKCAYGVKLNLICIIYAVADEEGRNKEDTKEEWFRNLLKADNFVQIRDGLSTMMEQIKLLQQVFAHEEVTPMPQLRDAILSKRPAEEVNRAIERLLTEAANDRSVLAKKDPWKLTTMEEDGPAQLCFVISCIRSLMQDMQEFKFEVLASSPA